jgi:uncharacterized protein (DUF58 family)
MMIKQFFEQLFPTKRLFFILLGVVVLFALSYVFEQIYDFVWMVLLAIIAFCLLEIIVLFLSKKKIVVSRILPDKLSNGDDNHIHLHIENEFSWKLYAHIIDELPFQFQSRDFGHSMTLNPGSNNRFHYIVRPTERGVYEFGFVHVYATTILGLVQRRFSSGNKQNTKCYPAFLALRNMDIRAIANEQIVLGARKIRRLGSTMEFEQIKEYVLGDDIRTINWKSSAKRGQLMVNQYQDEKSQDIYVAIDTGRTMEMPFNGLSLLDYSINASLMMLSLALAKHDRAGMFTFCKKIDNLNVAEKRPMQLQRIMEGLYNIETKFEESSFSTLYVQLKKRVAHRSLIVLFTNFESMDGLKRNLPFLVGIGKQHLLLVVFFKNKAIEEVAKSEFETQDELTEKILAGKIEYDKRVIARELAQHGILSLLTTPEALSIDVMNKYLEVKASGMI